MALSSLADYINIAFMSVFFIVSVSSSLERCVNHLYFRKSMLRLLLIFMTLYESLVFDMKSISPLKVSFSLASSVYFILCAAAAYAELLLLLKLLQFAIFIVFIESFPFNKSNPAPHY